MEKVTNKIKKCFKTDNYKVGQLIDSKEKVKWLPLLLCWPPDKYFGIAENGCWVVEGAEGMRWLDSPNEYWRIKVLMERSLDDVQTEFNKNLGTNNIDELKFPYIYILSEVFVNDTNYWVERAFSWFDTIPIKEKKLLIMELEILKNKKSLSQKLRHRALKEQAQLKKLQL
jgi:hypothetical protein